MGTKVSKMQLKALIKECLVEILQEGLGATGVPSSTTVNLPVVENRKIAQQNLQKRQNRVSPLDMPAFPNAGQRQQSPALAAAIRNEARGNPVMADILADTAMTTLPKMMSNGDSLSESSSTGSSKITQQEQFVGTPEQVFGEDVASKWANLAFMDAPSKKLL